jgi:murein DD-endopeptidase MepM/ murein hydrolase activator NlpD
MRSTPWVRAIPALIGAVLVLLAAVPPAARSEDTLSNVVIVRPGQTLWSLARAHGVSVDAIVEANGLERADLIAVGQRLVIPAPASPPSVAAASAASGAGAAQAVVTVRPGETLWSIARAYGVPVDAIVRVNRLSSANQIAAGQRLIIPPRAEGTPAPPRAVAANRPRSRTPSAVKTPPGKVPLVITVRRGETLFALARAFNLSVDAIAKANGIENRNLLSIGQRVRIPGRFVTPGPPPPPVPIPAMIKFGPKFVWPAQGDITPRFGWRGRRHHDGIDIGVPWGTSIMAARDGEVIFSGWYYGYGRTVIVDHGDGVTTIYGHASRLLVKRGQSVRRGQEIGKVGCTGRCTGSHLHFEIRINGRAVNPVTVFDVQSAVTASASQPPPAADAAAGEETVSRQSVVTDGGTVTTVREWVRQGTVVQREEVAVTTNGCRVTTVRRAFHLVEDNLEKIAEEKDVSHCPRSLER